MNVPFDKKKESFENDLKTLEELNTLEDETDLDLEELKRNFFEFDIVSKESCMKEIRQHLGLVKKYCENELESLNLEN